MSEYLFIFLMLGYIMGESTGDEGVCLNQDAVRSAEFRLSHDLLCNYDKEMRPVKNHNTALQINMAFKLLRIVPGEEIYSADIVTMKSMMLLFWTDEFLTWVPSDYSGIDEIKLDSSKIWIPQIVLFNSGIVPPSKPDEFNSECRVNFAGGVMCVPKVSHTAACKADHLHWPYDTQVCEMHYRIVSRRAEQVNLTNAGSVDLSQWTMDKLNEKNRHWELTSANVTREVDGSAEYNQTYPSLHYYLSMKRHSASLAAIVIVPGIAMILMTLMSLFLKVDSEERLLLISVNLLCHFLFLQQLFWQVPHNGDRCPLVVLFYRDSLMINVFVMLSTLMLKALLFCTSERVDVIIGIIKKPPANLIMFRMTEIKPQNEPTSEEIATNAEEIDTEAEAKLELERNWKIIVTFADRIQFIAVFIAYFALFMALLV